MNSKDRSFTLLATTAALALLFFLAAYFVTNIAPATLPPSKAGVFQAVFASICASLSFLFVIDAGLLIRESRNQRRFQTFFGDIDEHGAMTFVYPDFELSEKSRNALVDVSATEIYQKHSKHYAGPRFIDVPQIVASNDLLAIVITATGLGKLFGQTPRLLPDELAIQDARRCLISFGLTSNAVTDLYFATDLVPLFKIANNANNPRIIIQREGRTEEFGRNSREQHGLVLRFRPDPEHYPKTYWFICAGLAAAGTPAAAWCLSHNWGEYFSRFGTDDFLVVFKTSNDVLAYVQPIEVAALTRHDVKVTGGGR